MTVFEKNRIIENSMPTKIKKYAIYLRKSRADRDLEGQTVEEVLERHKTILLDLAVKQGLYWLMGIRLGVRLNVAPESAIMELVD